MWKCNGETILSGEILALNPVRGSPKKQEMGPKSQVLSEGWILGTAPWNVCLFLSYPEISVETWTNVVILYWTLLKIFYGFTVVKNSCEGVRTLISIGLWKEYSQIKLRSQRWRSIPGSGRSPGEGIGLLTPGSLGFPDGSDGKESTCNVEDLGSIPAVGKIPWRTAWQPTQVKCIKEWTMTILSFWFCCSCHNSWLDWLNEITLEHKAQ